MWYRNNAKTVMIDLSKLSKVTLKTHAWVWGKAPMNKDEVTYTLVLEFTPNREDCWVYPTAKESMEEFLEIEKFLAGTKKAGRCEDVLQQ